MLRNSIEFHLFSRRDTTMYLVGSRRAYTAVKNILLSKYGESHKYNPYDDIKNKNAFSRMLDMKQCY